MDTLSHGTWGAIIVRKAGLVWWALLTGALPDILPALYELARHPVKFIRNLINKSLADNPSAMYLRIYHWAHSLLPISGVSLVLVIFAPTRLVLVIPYYLHIFMDIFTHRGKWATRIFYPISDFHFEGMDWWRHHWISFANWAAICIAVLILISYR